MKLKALALVVTAAMTTCAPAHARSTADLAFEACNKLTQTVVAYQESGMSRAQVDALADRAISVPVMRDLLGEMFDIADDSGKTGFMLELAASTHCYKKTADMIVAAR